MVLTKNAIFRHNINIGSHSLISGGYISSYLAAVNMQVTPTNWSSFLVMPEARDWKGGKGLMWRHY